MHHAYFFIRVDRYFIKVSLDEIMYIEAKGSYMSIMTIHQLHTVLLSLKQLEKKLPEERFYRINRSIIVALDHITAFDDFQVRLGEKSFPLSKRYQKSLLNRVTILQADASE